MNETTLDSDINSEEEMLEDNIEMKVDPLHIKILKQRAIELSGKTNKIETKDRLLIIEFMIQGEKFAFDIEHIKQIFELQELTLLPCTPSFIAGIINFHGRIVPIINLSAFFDLEEKISNKKQIIILENSQLLLGVLSDQIIGIRYIYHHEFQSTLTTITQNVDLMLGITNDNTVILDALSVMTNEKFLINEIV